MPIPFTLRQLEYFIAVAEHGSITSAAGARNVSQPSISVAISDLEALLGRTLFRRETGRKLTITPAGRRLLVQARSIVATAARMPSSEMLSDIPSEISMACFRDLGAIYLPRLMTRYASQHPNVAFHILEDDLATVRTRLLDGRCELALTYDIGMKAAGISCKEIDRLAPHVLLPIDHPLSAASAIGFEQLAGERLVLEDFPVTLDFFLDMFKDRKIGIPQLQLAPSFEMQRSLVANGWGVGLSCVRPEPDMCYDGSRLVCVPLVSDEPSQVVVIAHLGEDTLSVAAHDFLAQVDAARPRTRRSAP